MVSTICFVLEGHLRGHGLSVSAVLYAAVKDLRAAVGRLGCLLRSVLPLACRSGSGTRDQLLPGGSSGYKSRSSGSPMFTHVLSPSKPELGQPFLPARSTQQAVGLGPSPAAW